MSGCLSVLGGSVEVGNVVSTVMVVPNVSCVHVWGRLRPSGDVRTLLGVCDGSDAVDIGGGKDGGHGGGPDGPDGSNGDDDVDAGEGDDDNGDDTGQDGCGCGCLALGFS